MRMKRNAIAERVAAIHDLPDDERPAAIAALYRDVLGEIAREVPKGLATSTLLARTALAAESLLPNT